MSTLISIAQDMERQAKRVGCAIRDLPRGLQLQLTWAAGNKTLFLSRPVVMPGEEEIDTCREAFQIPDSAQRTDGKTAVSFRWPA